MFSMIKSRLSGDRTAKLAILSYLAIWSVAIVLALLEYNGQRHISDYTFVLLLLNILSFILGFINIKSQNQDNSISEENIEDKINALINNRIFIVFLCLSTLYVLYNFVAFFNQVMFYGSMYDVRTNYYSDSLYGAHFNQIKSFILLPMNLICVPVFSFLVLRKFNWQCLVMGVYILIYAALGGGRGGYIVIAIIFFFINVCLFNIFKKYKSSKVLFIGIGIAIILFATLSLITSARMGNVSTVGNMIQSGVQETKDQIASYTSGPIAAFDYSLENNYVGIIGGYKLGNLTLSAPIATLNLFFSRLGFTIPQALPELVKIKQESWISVGTEGFYANDSWNALYTCLLFFYCDFGVFGVILIPFILGSLYRKILIKYYHTGSICILFIVSYLFECSMESIMDFYIRTAYLFLNLVILYIIGTRGSTSK